MYYVQLWQTLMVVMAAQSLKADIGSVYRSQTLVMVACMGPASLFPGLFVCQEKTCKGHALLSCSVGVTQ